jgi:hypothetical protein
MQKSILYGIIAAAVVVSAISIAFAIMALSNNPATTAVNTPIDSAEPRITETLQRAVMFKSNFNNARLASASLEHAYVLHQGSDRPLI